MSDYKGLLAVWMQPKPELEADLNQWYEHEHLSERMAIPGFRRVRRYEAIEGDHKYLALYDLDNVDVLKSEAYDEARRNATEWTRRTTSNLLGSIRAEYEQLYSLGEAPSEGAPYLLVVGLEVAPEHEEELNRWYDTEHLAALQGVEGVYSATRYRSNGGNGTKYLAVYEFAKPDIRDSAEWHKAADTPWTLEMRPRFTRRIGYTGKLLKTVM
jgi:hypothetical protein